MVNELPEQMEPLLTETIGKAFTVTVMGVLVTLIVHVEASA